MDNKQPQNKPLLIAIGIGLLVQGVGAILIKLGIGPLQKLSNKNDFIVYVLLLLIQALMFFMITKIEHVSVQKTKLLRLGLIFLVVLIWIGYKVLG